MMPSPNRGKLTMRLRPWPALAAALGIALTVSLGVWQMGRAQYKGALREQAQELSRLPPVMLGAEPVEAARLAGRKVEVRGRFAPEWMVYLDNRVHQHRHGYHVLMPLQIAGSRKHVLVNRGWIAAPPDRSRLPQVATPGGEVVVRGTVQESSERFLELSADVAAGRVWQNLTLERYRAATGLDLLPVVLQEEGMRGDGLVREWPALDFGRNTHLAYAFQWFALAAAILIAYVALNVHRRP